MALASSHGLPTDVRVPAEVEGNILCWDHHDEAGLGAIDGIAVTDLATERIWLIVANEAADDIEWDVLLKDNGFRALVPTKYGFSNADSPAEGMDFWEMAKQIVVSS